MGRIQRAMCSGMLVLEAIVLFLTTPVLLTLTDISTGVALAIGLGLTVACFVAAGLMRGRAGLILGWAIQVCALALGFVVTAMFALGLVFLALYGGSVVLGSRIDRERAEREQAEGG